MYKLFFGMLLASSLIACGEAGTKPGDEGTDADTTAAAPAEMKQADFADPKYVDMGKSTAANFESGNIDAWLNSYADDARYYWSGGDSLVGKEAISAYWKDRRANVVESLDFTNEIWLPITVNKAQANEATGTYLLNWFEVEAKYKTGKTAHFWAHNVHHFNSSDKIDQTILYIDRVPINAAASN